MKVRIYNHLGTAGGFGVAAEGLCMSLLQAGAELEIRPLRSSALAVDDGAALERLPVAIRQCIRADAELTTPDVAIVHTLPGDCPTVRRIVRETERHPDAGARYPWVAYTTWEASSAPAALVQALDESFDEIWHPSTYSADAFDEHLGDPPLCNVIPHAFDEATLEHRGLRCAGSDLDVYRFYYIGSWNNRKNPAALIRAYAHAFGTETSTAQLLLACGAVPRERFTHALACTGLDVRALQTRIKLSTQWLRDDDIAKLHQSADCFVTATRGEAWNLPAFDAMLAGRHIIAPQGTGHCDFLTRTSAVLYQSYPAPAAVDVTVSELANGWNVQVVGAQGLTSREVWPEPDIQGLATHMRAAHDRRVSELRIDYDPRTRYGYRAVGELAMGRLRALLTTTRKV